jgi:F-box-like
VKRIDVLPDDVLLEIFGFYVDVSSWYYAGRKGIEAWQSLVHVCRRWRSLVLGSPRHLNLQLFCKPQTPVKDTLDVWPALPLIVSGGMDFTGTDNVIAALGQSNRVSQVDLSLGGSKLENVLAAMQVPFPELTDLGLFSHVSMVLVIPDSFLGGSAPRLRRFALCSIPFPGLPKLLSSANNLVDLTLFNIPHSGYISVISPEEMVALLSLLSSLEELRLGFEFPQSRPDRESPSVPPPNRSILPALRKLIFQGVTEYLEDLVTFIDAPQLNNWNVIFYQIDFDCPRLAQFINCTPGLGARDEADVQFDSISASVKLRYQTPKTARGFYDFQIMSSRRGLEPDQQLSSVAQFCNFSLHTLSTVEDLYIEYHSSQRDWKNDAIENALWLRVLLPFTVVKNLYLSEEFAPGIAAALQKLDGGRITEVLPSLQNIFVEGLRVETLGLFQKKIGQFVAARQLSGHPIAISKYSRSMTKLRPW